MEIAPLIGHELGHLTAEGIDEYAVMISNLEMVAQLCRDILQGHVITTLHAEGQSPRIFATDAVLEVLTAYPVGTGWSLIYPALCFHTRCCICSCMIIPTCAPLVRVGRGLVIVQQPDSTGAQHLWTFSQLPNANL